MHEPEPATSGRQAVLAAGARESFALLSFERVSGSPDFDLLRIAGHWPDGAGPPAAVGLLVQGAERERVLPPLPSPVLAAPRDGEPWRVAFALLEPAATSTARYVLEAEGREPIALPAPVRHTREQAAHAQARMRASHAVQPSPDTLARIQSELRRAERDAADSSQMQHALRGQLQALRRQLLTLRRALVCVAALAGGALVVIAVESRPRDAPPGPAAAPPARAVPAAAAVPADASSVARASIPAAYLRVYARAGRRYGLHWSYLAAVGSIESDHGRSPLSGVTASVSGTGAAGPAQFLAAAWRSFGLDADEDGHISPYDPQDSVSAMAAYLRAHGAPEDWRRALHAYNHDWAYVDRILALAARYRQG